MKKLFSILLAGCISLLATPAFINSDELKEHLSEKNLILIDTTDADTYKRGHIPGAVRADISLFRHWVDKTYLLMNSPQQIEKEARSLGINNDSWVVLYGHNKDKEYLKASYIALALITNGFNNVTILNGGFNDWKYEFEGEKDAFSTVVVTPKKGNFTAKPRKDILVNLEYVKAHIGKTPMIEARPYPYYTGEQKSHGVRRLGHIKGAQSSFWRDKFNVDDTLKSDKKIKEIFIGKNGLNPDKEVIAYCTGGLEASMNWYLLTQKLGFKDVKLYDASMKQWGNRDDTPMEK